jgi:hypothetical protein
MTDQHPSLRQQLDQEAQRQIHILRVLRNGLAISSILLAIVSITLVALIVAGVVH